MNISFHHASSARVEIWQMESGFVLHLDIARDCDGASVRISIFGELDNLQSICASAGSVAVVDMRNSAAVGGAS